jgi:hypothetical protein
MPRLTLDLEALDVDGRPITDPDVFVRVASLTGTGASVARLSLDGAARRVRFDSGPAGSPLTLRLTTGRYRDGAVFARVSGGAIAPLEALRLPRRPSEWLPAFAAWDDLDGAFTPLKEALEASPQFRVGRGSPAERFVDDRYDAVELADEPRLLAKLSLLNLYARLRSEIMPDGDEGWFATVRELLVATRERIVADVDEACWALVRDLADSPRAGYRETPVGDHKQNLAEIAGIEQIADLASVKTREARGNLQLTVARVRRDGRDGFLLDADMDENGQLLLHTFDLIKHAFNGGTHPIDIHECLRVLLPAVALGYALEPRTPVAVTAGRVLAVARTAAAADVVPPAAPLSRGARPREAARARPPRRPRKKTAGKRTRGPRRGRTRRRAAKTGRRSRR